MRRVNAVLSGLGNIGSRFVKILEQKRAVLHEKYDLDVHLIAVADSKGAAIALDGLDLTQIANLQGESISRIGQVGLGIIEILQQVDADIFFEATPVNLKTGEPGLSAIRTALKRGMHVVSPNKGPLALSYGELRSLAKEYGVQLRHSGAVFGGLPTVNIGQRDLAGSTILKIEAQANLANSYILHRMGEGMPYKEAVRAAQEQGCCAPDETLDVEGWDAIIKLVILSNSVLGIDARIDDVKREGITHLTPEDIATVKADGKSIKYIASAVRLDDESYELSVGPRALAPNHLLVPLGELQMGVAYTSDLYGTIMATILEEESTPSAASLLRDMLTIYSNESRISG